MGHLLMTTNPEAAARINGEGRPMPGVGETVLYHPRAGEVRQGRKTVPAIVLKVDQENRQLEIMIIHAADDMITQNQVPEHVEGDRGWSRLAGDDHATTIKEMQAHIQRLENWNAAFQDKIAYVFGDFELPEGESIMSLIDKLDGRIGDIEDAKATVTKMGAAQEAMQDAAPVIKRGRGRPRRGA